MASVSAENWKIEPSYRSSYRSNTQIWFFVDVVSGGNITSVIWTSVHVSIKSFNNGVRFRSDPNGIILGKKVPILYGQLFLFIIIQPFKPRGAQTTTVFNKIARVKIYGTHNFVIYANTITSPAPTLASLITNTFTKICSVHRRTHLRHTAKKKKFP